MSITFEAKFAGRCGPCGQPFAEGDQVFYNDDDTLVGAECCGNPDEPRTDLSRTEPRIPVMPRGKTAKDRCDGCFQIPAANGVCGCS
jgi:hypothetical protein